MLFHKTFYIFKHQIQKNMQLTNVSAEFMIKIVYIPGAYLEHSQTSTMEFFAKIVNGL